MNNYEVIAVIVTYNRKDMLLRLLERLFLFNLKSIIVVDNSERAILDANTLSSKIVYYKTIKNIGGAGGYNIGIKKAREIGCDFVWLLDDDSIPELDALNSLLDSYAELNKSNTIVSYVCSKVLWADSNEECLMNIPSYSRDGGRFAYLNIKEVQSCSFVSVLIPLEYIERIGLPIKEYFIWFDDVEYTNRLNNVGFGFQICNSLVRHYTKLNQGANFGFVNSGNIKKFKYGIRNMVAFYRSNRKFKRLIKIFIRINKEMSNSNVSINYRIIIFIWFVKGLFFYPTVENFD